jgi:hypothetical protein
LLDTLVDDATIKEQQILLIKKRQYTQAIANALRFMKFGKFWPAMMKENDFA